MEPTWTFNPDAADLLTVGPPVDNVLQWVKDLENRGATAVIRFHGIDEDEPYRDITVTAKNGRLVTVPAAGVSGEDQISGVKSPGFLAISAPARRRPATHRSPRRSP